MRQPSYKHYLPEIQELKRNRLYSFVQLSKRRPPDKMWAVCRRTLERECKNLQLICYGRTVVLGGDFIDWAIASAEERRKVIKEKRWYRYWPPRNRGTQTEGEKT